MGGIVDRYRWLGCCLGGASWKRRYSTVAADSIHAFEHGHANEQKRLTRKKLPAAIRASVHLWQNRKLSAGQNQRNSGSNPSRCEKPLQRWFGQIRGHCV